MSTHKDDREEVIAMAARAQGKALERNAAIAYMRRTAEEVAASVVSPASVRANAQATAATILAMADRYVTRPLAQLPDAPEAEQEQNWAIGECPNCCGRYPGLHDSDCSLAELIESERAAALRVAANTR